LNFPHLESQDSRVLGYDISFKNSNGGTEWCRERLCAGPAGKHKIHNKLLTTH
jgi:hypothetical protein